MAAARREIVSLPKYTLIHTETRHATGVIPRSRRDAPLWPFLLLALAIVVAMIAFKKNSPSAQ